MNMSTVTFLNLGLQSLLLSVLGWLLVRVCLRDARQRVWAAILTLSVAVIAPLLMTLEPESAEAELPVPAEVPPPTWKPDWTVKLAPISPPPLEPRSPAPADAFQWIDLAPALIWTWLGGSALLGILHLAGTVHALRWRGRLRKGQRSNVWEYDGHGSPCVAGLWKPVIAVPAGTSAAWTDDQWRWLFAHEGEHVHGRDPAVAWTLGWLRAMLWWNPFIHDLISQWSLAREEVCDAVAVAPAGDHERYASFLLDIASRAHQTPAIAMAASRPARRLRTRLTSLLEGRRVCQRLGRRFMGGSLVVVATAVALVSCSGVRTADTSLTDNGTTSPYMGDQTVRGTPAGVENQVSPPYNGALQARVFHVPADLMNRLGGGPGARPALKQRGVAFPEGATAIFNPATSQLIVKQTRTGLRQIAAILDEVSHSRPQLYLQIRLIESTSALGKDEEVHDERWLSDTLGSLNQQTGINILQSPALTMRLNSDAAIEIASHKPGDDDIFAGLRIPVHAEAAGARVQLKGAIIVGEVPGEPSAHRVLLPTSRTKQPDWSKVRQTKTNFNMRLNSGDTGVLNMGEPAKGQFRTALLTARAISPGGKDLRDFKESGVREQHDSGLPGAPLRNGVVAVDNGYVITQVELDEFIQAETIRIRQQHHDDPATAASMVDLFQGNALELYKQWRVIAAAQRKAGHAPKAEVVDAEIEALIKTSYGGSRDALVAGLAKRGMTLAKYRKLTEDRLMTQTVMPPPSDSKRIFVTVKVVDVVAALDEKGDPSLLRAVEAGDKNSGDLVSIMRELTGGASAGPVLGVLTDPQFQVVIRALNQEPGVKMTPLSNATVKSGESARLKQDEFAYDVQPAMGRDGYTIDLAVSDKRAPDDPEHLGVAVTIWDGQTLICGKTLFEDKKTKERHIRTLFVTAKIIDLKGGPVLESK